MSSSNGLLVIDVQKGFVTERTNEVAGKIKDLLEGEIFDPVIFTRFRNDFQSAHYKFLGWEKMMSDEECEIWPAIREHADKILDKRLYTSLTDELREFIEAEGIDTLFLSGLDTECCVLKTAVDLFEIGVRPIVLAQFCASNGGEESHVAGLTALTRLIGPGNIVSFPTSIDELRVHVEEILKR